MNQNSGQVDNLRANDPEAAQTQQDISQQLVSGVSEQPLKKSLLKTGKKWFIPVLVIVVVLALGVASVFAYQNFQLKKEQSQEQSINSLPLPATAPSPQTSLFSGQLKKLDQNLKLFRLTKDDVLNGVENNFTYYEAGKFNQGELKDYTRIVLVRTSGGPAPPLVFVLATKDFQNYILNDPDNKIVEYPEDDWKNPYHYLDKSKISSTKTFDTEQPKEIDLSQNFALYFEDFSTGSILSNKTDKNGNVTYESLLITDFSSYKKLDSPSDNLDIYFKPHEVVTIDLNELDETQKEIIQLKQKYLLTDTSVVVVDSVGLPVLYSLTTPENVAIYKDELAQYKIDWKKYQDQSEKFRSKKITEYPRHPDLVHLPNLGFDSSRINSQSSFEFYSDYRTAIPGACVFSLNSEAVNVSDNDLEEIGSISNLVLYRLKDVNHLLYTLAYKNKFNYYDRDPTSWDSMNKGVEKPNLEEYVDRIPLLFFKDHWQRWIALGEFDIQLPGGCGKPVIYLYPTEPTEVSVRFQVPVELTIDIPRYADFWQVMAHPDGSLVNLKPKDTDCRQINYQKKGSEYAKEACQNNTYPYLYWAGSVNSGDYPVVDKGWVVKKDNLNGFFENKLTEIGLNNKEKKDFTEYWLPDLLVKDAPYYKISFLQTNDLNLLFPMTVDPKPDTTFRIFLDYLPLTKKPSTLPQPQVLDKLVRNGFTLVEWGGLKQP